MVAIPTPGYQGHKAGSSVGPALHSLPIRASSMSHMEVVIPWGVPILGQTGLWEEENPCP